MNHKRDLADDLCGEGDVSTISRCYTAATLRRGNLHGDRQGASAAALVVLIKQSD